jgi:hypothetical protein
MLLQDPDKPDLHTGIQAGIAAKRLLLREGYGNPGTSPVEAGLRFPVERIAAEIGSGNAALATAFIQDPVSNLLPPYNSQSKRVMPGFWTILEDRYTDHLSMVAQRIVLEGIVPVLKDIPIGRFGALVTVDRREIEALQSIRTLLIEYCKRPQVRPLSLAVFGPPGSGKSFAVKQIAKSILPGEIQTITFNISQFDEQEDLFDALHQVRDIGLSGKIPLVFWDEFDSDLAGYPLGWLRYYLSPMQDGTFQEGEIIHPIGRSIFIFAGATSHTMKAFGRNLSEEQQRTVKLPDFISRLKGYLNVLGPNPLQGIEDPYFIIRRAILLRSMFERLTPQIIQEVSGIQQVQIDNGLLRALLETRRYRHGVRSIETILSISRLSDAASFERSSLPAEDQLNLHVEADDFLARVHAIQLEDDVLERLACAAHDLFCETLRDQGYKYGDRHNSDKSHPTLVPYEQLPEYLKHANRSTVLDIANKLAITGYVMIPARSNEPAFDFPGKDLEILAELEHQRWLQEKETAGWQYAPETRETEKLHSAMMSWDELPEDEKQKDREMVRSIPRILAKAGYAVLKL